MDLSQILYQSFYELVEKKGFDNITVSDILATSDVSRSTFYRHFQDKYELMSYGFKRHFEELNFQAGKDSWKEMIHELLTYLQAHYRYFNNIIDIDGQNSLRKYLLHFCIDFTRETVQENAQNIEWNFFYEESIHYTANGGLAVTIDWIKEGCTQSIDDVTTVIFENISPTLRPYLLAKDKE